MYSVNWVYLYDVITFNLCKLYEIEISWSEKSISIRNISEPKFSIELFYVFCLIKSFESSTDKSFLYGMFVLYLIKIFWRLYDTKTYYLIILNFYFFIRIAISYWDSYLFANIFMQERWKRQSVKNYNQPYNF